MAAENLHEAAKRGDVLSVQASLRSGIDVNASGWDGITALIAASNKGHLEVVQLLLENGADVNAKPVEGWPALMVASYEGNLAVVRLLIANGADVNAREAGGYPVLWYARSGTRGEPGDRDAIVELLTAKGAEGQPERALSGSDATSKQQIEFIDRALERSLASSVRVAVEVHQQLAEPTTHWWQFWRKRL